MSTEAVIAIVAIGVTVIGALIAVMVRVSVALQKLSDTTDRLIMTLDDHDERLGKVENDVKNHEGRIIAIESIHKIRGCDKEVKDE
jgi:hypothetical protein